MTAATVAATLPVQQRIWKSWTGLWNGQPVAPPHEFVCERVAVHLPTYGMPPAGSIDTRDKLVAWIAGFRSCYEADATFTATHGPWDTGGFVVARWRFSGTWLRAVPATASAPSGTAVAIGGVDILRIENGRIAEYWLSDDQLDLYSQLGAHIADTPRIVDTPRGEHDG